MNPGEEKYRRLRLSNPRIAAAIVEVAGALDALLALGWERDEGDAEALVCPKYAKMTMAGVRVSGRTDLGLIKPQNVMG